MRRWPTRARTPLLHRGTGAPRNSAAMATSNESAVSWGAIFAGAVGAAVLSLVLFVLGTGLGLAVVSPWARDGISGTAAGVSTIVWVTTVSHVVTDTSRCAGP